MTGIDTPIFTEADIYVIENTNREVLKVSIEFLKTYNEVMWEDGDTGDIVTLSELRGRQTRIQPCPIYPEKLRQMGEMFWRMMWKRKDLRIKLRAEGYFSKTSFAAECPGTMFSAAAIASVICDAFVRERTWDGLFGHGVENGLYLKMLLRLEDLISYYDYSKATPVEGCGCNEN